MLKTIFLGNSDFCIPTLRVLNNMTQVLTIITGLDKELTHRSKSIQKPLPKIYGEENNIPILQPKIIKDPKFLTQIQHLTPDLMIVISYGKILPSEFFNIASLGTFNLHASLLPAYRGASPIQEALLRNDTETGITLQKINEKMDDGNIHWIKKHLISPHILYPALRSELAELAAQTLQEFLEDYQKTGKISGARPQVGTPSFCGKIKKEDGFIDFRRHSAQEIYNKFRAFYTWPQVFFAYKGKMIKLEDIQVVPSTKIDISPAGSVVQANKEALIVKTSDGYLKILQVKPQNKNTQDYISFINGYQIKQGDLLC